jgi:osmotically-inducible protein OsmY
MILRGDKDIATQIMAELRWDPGVSADQVGVLASYGSVVLSGFVDGYSDWWTAGRIASQVRGVRAVDNRIEVRLPRDRVRADHAILADCARALDESALGPVDPIQVRVENGWVTLDGRVEVTFLAARAERAVRGVVGIRGLTNRISVGRPAERANGAARGKSGPRHADGAARTPWDRRPPRP